MKANGTRDGKTEAMALMRPALLPSAPGAGIMKNPTSATDLPLRKRTCLSQAEAPR